MVQIPIEEVRSKIKEYITSLGMREHDADIFSELVVEQELVGNQFSAIGELAGKHARMMTDMSGARESLEVEKNAAMLIKGNGRMAPLITADYLDGAVAKAKENGIFALGIYDSTYNEYFDVFCRRIASQDCIGIIVENGGPQGVVPFGGLKDVTGTNPIAYGIPTNNHPIVFDAATAMHAYGRIKQAKERGELLPENAYVDKEGNITTDPNVAYAVLPFGGFKGYAINLLIDVLSGSLVCGKSGLDQPTDSQRFIGTFVIVIDPASFGDLDTFKVSTTKLAADITAVPARDADQPVRVPGARGSERAKQFLEQGILEIEDLDWQKFLAAYESIKK